MDKGGVLKWERKRHTENQRKKERCRGYVKPNPQDWGISKKREYPRGKEITNLSGKEPEKLGGTEHSELTNSDGKGDAMGRSQTR